MRAESRETGRSGGGEVGGAVGDGFTDAFEVVEGIVKLVAMAGLVGEAFLEAGFEFVAPAGERVVVFLQTGLRVRSRREGGGGGTGGGGWFGHARDERSRVMGCGFRPASAEAENIFSRVGAGRWQAENRPTKPGQADRATGR